MVWEVGVAEVDETDVGECVHHLICSHLHLLRIQLIVRQIQRQT